MIVLTIMAVIITDNYENNLVVVIILFNFIILVFLTSLCKDIKNC